jgi:DAACS family dicarboxylate/amino acid:cation (Na+ or H+) symporter
VTIGLQIVAEISTRIVHMAMRLAPYAVAALVAAVVMLAGISILKTLALFVTSVVVVMALHLVVTTSILLKLFTRRSPREFFRAIRAVLVTAFSTSSSSATLPTTIQVSREVLGVSPTTAGFVLPLGATMNMGGTALYEGCVVLFIAQVYGIDLNLAQQIQLIVLAVFSAVAVAGIPGGALPVIISLLVTFGIPPEGVALILGFERILDMARTVLNVGGDMMTACVVDEWSRPLAPGELDPGPSSSLDSRANGPP